MSEIRREIAERLLRGLLKQHSTWLGEDFLLDGIAVIEGALKTRDQRAMKIADNRARELRRMASAPLLSSDTVVRFKSQAASAEYQRLSEDLVSRLQSENEALRTQNQTQRESITYFQENERKLKAQLAEVEQERERLLRGEFTDQELQGFCHNLDVEDRQAFFDGCTKYQERLFGTCAIAELTRSENSQ